MNTINTHIHSITAFAPATCANVAVGFDILGFALSNIGDEVTLTLNPGNHTSIESIDAKDPLPLDVDKNIASFVVKKLCQDLKLERGFAVRIKKGIPLSSGMGGSAASAIAALVACNAFLNQPLRPHQLLHYALQGESQTCGEPHADNIIPSLFGGFTLIHSLNPIDFIHLPIPDVYCVLIHPHLRVTTYQARHILKPELPLKTYVKQSAHLAAFISALYSNNQVLLQQSMTDLLIEPQRAHFVPGFEQVKEAALSAGALGMSFSGSGPSLFAFARNMTEAERIRHAMQTVLKNKQIDSNYWISRINKNHAYVTNTVFF